MDDVMRKQSTDYLSTPPLVLENLLHCCFIDRELMIDKYGGL